MTRLRRAFLDPRWPIYLKDMGLDPVEVLKNAHLAGDTFHREVPLVHITEYFRLWEALDLLSRDPADVLKFAGSIRPENISLPVVAFLYSDNLSRALETYVQFRPLIGPTTYSLTKSKQSTTLAMESVVEGVMVPVVLSIVAQVFLVHLVRSATRKKIVPQSVEIHGPVNSLESYEEFLGCPIRRSETSRIKFRQEDTEVPFLTANTMLRRSLEKALRLQLSELDNLGSMRERVREWLTQGVIDGRTSMEEAASSLGLSARTLQRRLQDEGSSFKKELNTFREEAARQYLTLTRLSTAEIACRLGYSDSSSFFRAFHEWTNMTPYAVRSAKLLS